MANSQLKAVGILTNQASRNPSRSAGFYKDLISIKFMSKVVAQLSQGSKLSPSDKYIIQVVSVIMHPVYGEVMLFPWRKHTSGSKTTFLTPALMTFNDFLPIIDSLK
jgi:hypothetical protein